MPNGLEEPGPAVESTCQLYSSGNMGREPAAWRWMRLFRRVRKGVALRTRLQRLYHAVLRGRPTGPPGQTPSLADTARQAAAPLAPGDRVRVRALQEITQTLDDSGRCHGCAFLAPMGGFCGREFRVLRRVERFFDERRWRMLRCQNVVLLERVHCDGSGHPATRGCDRMCYFFWRTEWLEHAGDVVRAPESGPGTVARSTP